MEAIGEECGMDSVSPPLGPFPIEDTFGMKAACVLLQRSLDSGKTERFIQFSTARKIRRSAYSIVYHSSQELSSVTVMALKLRKTYSTECPTYGYWFKKFILGCHKRMGDVVCSDFALSKPLFLELVDDLEDDWDDCQNEVERFKVAGFAMVLLSTFLCGLGGEEVMKSDIAGLVKYLDIGVTDIFHPHVIIAFLGRLKGEVREQYHMVVMARVTNSDTMTGRWADQLAKCLIDRGRRNGFVFVDKKGNQAKIGSFDEDFHERMYRVKMRVPHLFELGIEINVVYSLRRSGQRGSTSEATNGGVPREVVELNNRWRKIEGARGRRPGMGHTTPTCDSCWLLFMFTPDRFEDRLVSPCICL
jgi:hypothetical protein